MNQPYYESTLGAVGIRGKIHLQFNYNYFSYQLSVISYQS